MSRAFGDAWMRARRMADTGAEDVRAALRGYLQDVLARDASLEMTRSGGAPLTLWPLRALEDTLADHRERLAERDTAFCAHTADTLMQRHGLPDDARKMVSIGVLEAEIRRLEEAIKRARGEVPLALIPDVSADAPAPAPAPALPLLPPPAPPKPTAASLLDAHLTLRETRGEISAHQHGQEDATLRRFVEVCGDRPVDAYGRGDVTGFLDTLRRLPISYGQSPKNRTRTLAEIIADADANGESVPRLSDKTVKRHLSALAQFFAFVRDRGHITNAQRSEMVDDHRFAAQGGAKTQRDAWTSEELKALFASPVWTGCASEGRRNEPGTVIHRDSLFWLPILGLFQGARLEEMADLYRRDVRCVDGLWLLDIRESEDAGPQGRKRRLKTASATRAVPLHDEARRIGFLRYVERIAPGPNDPIFPDLRPQGEDHRRGPRFTRNFGYYRRKTGVYREDVGMHSFRHTAITRLRGTIANYQQERHIDYLMGHARGGGEGRERYDKGPSDLRELKATLDLLRYPELDFSALHEN